MTIIATYAGRRVMTRLQRLLLILLIIVFISQLSSIIFYFLEGARGFPAFLLGLFIIPVLGIALWQDMQRTQRGAGLGPVLEHRIIQDFIISMVVVLIVPIGLAVFVRTIFAWNVGIGLSMFSSLIISLFVVTYVVYIRRKG